MSETSANSGELEASGTDRTAQRRDRRMQFALRMAAKLAAGTLTLVLPDGTSHRFAATPTPAATIVIRDSRALTRLALGGRLGFAEAYLDEMWETPDLRGLMALAAANEDVWLATMQGSWWARTAAHLLHRLRTNTRTGAKRNIIEHYDLGNDFFATWLDAGMNYSSALFAGPDDALEAAQERKLRHMCDSLALRPGLRLLEIGCGWGGFAEMAARDYGAEVVAITLSPSQLEFAQARIARAGLSGKVEFRLQDYRDVTGTFDRIASIEMFEAVGEKYWPAYFRTLRDRLVPGGLAGVQTITIADSLFAEYRRTADFIQRHIFPGGMLPSPSRFSREATRAGLREVQQHWFGQDYAETLARWYATFERAWPDIHRRSRHMDGRFKRLWEFYLAYCETGFRHGWTDVGQVLLTRPA
jgi:cyclopropane-fatty-acyl-phospholipid synthase